MEKKELTQEQIEKIAAGTGAEFKHIIFIHGLLMADHGLLKREDALIAKAKEAGVDLPGQNIVLIAKAAAAEML